MAKKKGKLLESAGVSPEAAGCGMNFSELFDKAIAKVAKQGGRDLTELDGNRRAALVGLPLGHLSMEVLFSESVFGLGRVICLDGLTESCKTSFMWEICRIFNESGGGSVIVDTEHKSTEDLGPGIVGYEEWSKIQYAAADSIEETFRIYTNMIDIYKTKAKSSGKMLPVLLGMDSISGAVTEGEAKSIDKAGTSARGFAGGALLASKYIPYLVSQISNLPFAFVAVRHLRQIDMGRGLKGFEAKGGGEWDYDAMKTYRFSQNGVAVNKVGSGGRPLNITAKKGTGEGLKVPVVFKWHDVEDETGENRRIFQWDWGEATIKLLSDMDKQNVPQRIQRAVKEVFGSMSVTLGKTSCKALGLTKVSGEDFEEALYDPTNAEILKAARAAFCIRVGQEYRAGEDFDEKKTIQRGIILGRKSPSAVVGVRSVIDEEDYEQEPESEEELEYE